jgi:hypothetical protein
MEEVHFRFAVPDTTDRYLPGSYRSWQGAKYREFLPKGTHGSEKIISTVPVKQVDVSGSILQNGVRLPKYSARGDRRRTINRFLPRGGNVMRVVGADDSEDPATFVLGQGPKGGEYDPSYRLKNLLAPLRREKGVDKNNQQAGNAIAPVNTGAVQRPTMTINTADAQPARIRNAPMDKPQPEAAGLADNLPKQAFFTETGNGIDDLVSSASGAPLYNPPVEPLPLAPAESIYSEVSPTVPQNPMQQQLQRQTSTGTVEQGTDPIDFGPSPETVKLLQQVARLDEQLGGANSEIVELASTNRGLELQANTLQQQRLTLERTVEDLRQLNQSNNAQYERRHMALAGMLELNADRVGALSAELQNVTVDLESVREERRTAQEEMSRVRMELLAKARNLQDYILAEGGMVPSPVDENGSVDQLIGKLQTLMNTIDAGVRQSLRNAEDERNNAEAQLQAALKQCAGLQAEILKRERQLAETSQFGEQEARERQALSTQLTVAQEESRMLQERLMSANDLSGVQRQTLQQQLQQQQSEIQQLQQQLATERQQFEAQVEAQFEQALIQQQRLNRQLAEAREEVQSLTRQLANSSMTGAEQQWLERQLRERDADIEQLSGQLRQAANEIEQLQTSAQQLDVAKAELEKAMNRLKRQASDFAWREMDFNQDQLFRAVQNQELSNMQQRLRQYEEQRAGGTTTTVETQTDFASRRASVVVPTASSAAPAAPVAADLLAEVNDAANMAADLNAMETDLRRIDKRLRQADAVGSGKKQRRDSATTLGDIRYTAGEQGERTVRRLSRAGPSNMQPVPASGPAADVAAPAPSRRRRRAPVFADAEIATQTGVRRLTGKRGGRLKKKPNYKE